MSKSPSPRFEWERAIVGPNGPASPITRLVLLALATHVPRGKDCAYPSLRTIEAETRLSRQCVIDHLAVAVGEGWLRKEFTRLDGMRHRGNVYRLAVPSGQARLPVSPVASGLPRLPVEATCPQGGASGLSNPASGQRDEPEVVNVSQTSGQRQPPHYSFQQGKEQGSSEQGAHAREKAGKYPGSGTAKLNGKGNGQSARQESGGVAQWAERLGIVRAVGEHEGAFQVRVFAAKLAFEQKQGAK